MKILGIDKMRFTAIEWVLLLVVVFILSAIAIPRFYNPFGKAQQNKVDGIAASLTNAASTNYETCEKAKKTKKCRTVAKCSDVAKHLNPPLILGNAGESGVDQYNLTIDTPVEKNGLKATCTLQIKKLGVLYSQTYTIIGAGN